jgi:hypothetical protein
MDDRERPRSRSEDQELVRSPTTDARRVGAPAAVIDGLIMSACALGPLIWRILAGSGRWPAGDAWAYERIFRTFHRTGHVALVGWNDINLIGMLPITEPWAAVFGDGPHQLHVLGSMMGVVFLLGVRDVLGTVGVRQRAFPLAVVGLSAAFVGAAGTYLSDVFATAGAVWGLAVILRLTGEPISKRRSALLVFVAALCLAYAFLVRQHAAVAVLAAAWTLYRQRDRRHLAWMFSGLFATMALPWYLWRRSLEHGGVEVTGLYVRSGAAGLIAMWFTLGLVALPLTFRLDAKQGMTPWRYVVLAMPPALVVVATLVDAARPLARGQSLPGELVVHGGLIGWFAAALAIAAATIGWRRMLCASMLPRSDRAPLLQQILVASIIGEAAIVFVGGAYFARYSVLSGALLVCLLASHRALPAQRPAPDRAVWAPGAVAAVLGFCSYLVVDFSIRWIGATEQAAAVASCAGIVDSELDAGFIWNGLHTDTAVESNSRDLPADDGLPMTSEQAVFVGMNRQGVVTSDLPADPSAVAVAGPFRSSGLIPGNTEERWLVVRRTLAAALSGCVAPQK